MLHSAAVPDSGGTSDADTWSLERLAELVNSFIVMMNAGNMSRLEIEYGELRLSLRAHGDAVTTGTAGMRAVIPHVANSVLDDVSDFSGSHVVTAPMIGTFYASPAPGDPPFVAPGDRIEEGQTIGIIEAMKIMNEIASDRAGIVLEVIAGNSQSVEFGSPLVRLEPSTS
jgi:acetyl-CoA carboxylase biotin carboxyl carrier protein